MKPTMIDVFAGAGGMSLGFSKYFNPVSAVDLDPYAVETYKMNFPDSNVFHGDVVDFLDTDIPQCDIAIGGPPCQGFSAAANAKRKRFDERRSLWKYFVDVCVKCNVKCFVMENVNNMVHYKEFKDMLDNFSQNGFHICHYVLNAADYGAPTIRTRVFVIGLLGKKLSGKQIQKTHSECIESIDFFSDKEIKKWVSVYDAIGDLPLIAYDKNTFHEYHECKKPPLNLHYDITMPHQRQYLKYIPSESNWSDVNKEYILKKYGEREFKLCENMYNNSGGLCRKIWNKPSHTLTTRFNKVSDNYTIHPTENRTITLREAARIMSFPDSYKWHGSNKQIAQQIGNAVVPLLAEKIAKFVSEEIGA